MTTRINFLRSLFFLFLLTCLLVALVGTVRVPVKAASSNIVISQIYGGGGNSGAPYTNDYVELFNLGPDPVTLTGWSIQYASATGSFPSAPTSIVNLSGSILPGQYYLVQLAGGANGIALPAYDAIGSISLSATAGKVALVNTTTALSGNGCPISASVIDFVGYGTSANCFEGTTAPAPSDTTAIIRTNICSDTDNNNVDFVSGAPSPRNSSEPPIACVKVLNITSSTPNGTYTVGTVPSINIDIEFSVPVNVTGQPYLLLETGANDNRAIFVTGSDGDRVLTFEYVVAAGDVSGDLDYVSKDSLVLNGGTITGAAGDAVLTLPSPGTAGSLGANKDIVIDNGVAPSITSIKRQTPLTSLTNAPSLVYRVTFSKYVQNVDVSDFVATGAGAPTSFVQVTESVYDIAVSGGSPDLSTFNGVVGLSLSAGQDITDKSTPPLSLNPVTPSINETYTVDHIRPDITIIRPIDQPATTGSTPVNFTVTFSEDINVGSFTVGDITNNIPATGITWSIIPTSNPRVFTLSAIAISAGGTTNLQPIINANQVNDLAGNGNNASSTPAAVSFDNDIAPTVTITDINGQDPTNTLPIKFNVKFSEAIIASIFTPSDVTQGPVTPATDAATDVTWSITDSGDHTNFTLSAISATSGGIIFPYIAANRVTDLVGNNNVASTTAYTDTNTVVYDITRPTITINQATGQADPTSALPINFTVVFSEPINVSTFTADVLTQAGTATGIVWNITNADAGVNRTFTLSATAMTKNGTLIPAIGINKVTDLAGNNNFPSTSTDNAVTFTGTVSTPTRTPTPTATATPTLGVIISEVAWMGTVASSSDEWVELYNGGSTVIDLSNWTLKSTDGTINITFLATDSDHIIAPGEFFVLAPSGSFTDVVINKNITASFNDNGKSLELRNNLGILIDTANSNGGPWPAGKGSPTYATMERHAGTILDSDINWYTFAGTPTAHDRSGNLVKGTPGYPNWAKSVTATPSPLPTATRTPIVFKTSTPAPPPPPPLIGINEFLPRPGHDWNNDGFINTGDEYIELINHGVVSVNLSGYKLDDEANIGSSPFNLPSVTLESGERIVFYGKDTGLLLSDGGDGVRLLKPNGQLMDAYNYFTVEFPDQSFCRLPDNGGLDDWNTKCYPTPGLRNSLSGSLLRPPTEGDADQPLCPIADMLPEGFVLAECTPFGHNIWNRFYWDKGGWFGEKKLPNLDGRWEAFGD